MAITYGAESASANIASTSNAETDFKDLLSRETSSRNADLADQSDHAATDGSGKTAQTTHRSALKEQNDPVSKSTALPNNTAPAPPIATGLPAGIANPIVPPIPLNLGNFYDALSDKAADEAARSDTSVAVLADRVQRLLALSEKATQHGETGQAEWLRLRADRIESRIGLLEQESHFNSFIALLYLDPDFLEDPRMMEVILGFKNEKAGLLSNHAEANERFALIAEELGLSGPAQWAADNAARLDALATATQTNADLLRERLDASEMRPSFPELDFGPSAADQNSETMTGNVGTRSVDRSEGFFAKPADLETRAELELETAESERARGDALTEKAETLNTSQGTYSELQNLEQQDLILQAGLAYNTADSITIWATTITRPEVLADKKTSDVMIDFMETRASLEEDLANINFQLADEATDSGLPSIVVADYLETAEDFAASAWFSQSRVDFARDHLPS